MKTSRYQPARQCCTCGVWMVAPRRGYRPGIEYWCMRCKVTADIQDHIRLDLERALRTVRSV